jgi:hypothetical protein
MKRKALIAIVGTLFFVLVGSLTGMCGETDDVSPSLIYGALVDKYIHKCEAKAKLLDSDSLNIQKSAIRATLKGAFIQSNRSTMIEYLMENNVPFNAHRIEYHLTRKFTESVHPQKVYAMLLKDNVVQ